MGQTQHPFYWQRLEDGRLAMSQGNWELAEKLLEIAAFGLMEDETALSEIWVRMVLVKSRDQNKDSFEAITLADRALGKEPVKPDAISAEEWDEFLIITEKKAPRIPEDHERLKAYVLKYPDNKEGWRALIKAEMATKDKRSLRKTLDDALKRFPGDVGFLENRLLFSVVHRENAGKYATALMKVDPGSSLAHEFLGNEAMKKGAYEQARAHYRAIQSPVFSETEKYLSQLSQHTQAMEAAAEKEQKAAQTNKRPKKKQETDSASTEQPVPTANTSSKQKKKASDTAKTQKSRGRGDGAKKKKTEPEKTIEIARNPPESQKPQPASEPELTAEEKREQKARIKELVKAVKAKATPANQRDLAWLYLDDRNYSKAEKLLRRMNNSTPEFYEVFARYHYLKKNYEDIINAPAFQDTDKLKSDKVRFYLGMSYFRMNEFKKAREILAPLDRDVHKDLAEIDKELASQPLQTPSPKSTKLN